MTVAVGVLGQDGSFAVAADTSAENGYRRIHRRDPKFRRVREWWFAHAGAASIERFIDEVASNDGLASLEDIAEAFANWGDEKRRDGNILVVGPSQLAEIDRLGALIYLPGPFAAIGAGSEVALGALTVLTRHGLPTVGELHDIATTAVLASIRWSTGCSGEAWAVRVVDGTETWAKRHPDDPPR